MKISLKFVHSRPIDSKSSLVQVMARHWTCDKPLLEPLMIRIYDAILHHMATVSYDVAFRALIQYKDVVLPVWEIPLWR